MSRTIALSNLSLLPGALIKGPKWAWKTAREAGFDAFKVNPLRGWEGEKLRDLGIPVSAFEAPWRTSFQESCSVLLKGDWMGFIADTCFFGYTGAVRRSEGYGDVFPKAIGVDCPNWYGDHFIHARETECRFEKWPNPLDGTELACLDTWHVRSYPKPRLILEVLASQGRVILIDVQPPRDNFEEFLGFLRGEDVLLTRQLRRLASLPGSVSASAEIAPQDVYRLMGSLSLSYVAVLQRIQQRIRIALN